MHTAISSKQRYRPLETNSGKERTTETIETRLWLEEHDWLFAVLTSEQNVSPTFRFPDLISACVSIVFTYADAAARIFGFLGSELVLRHPQSPRRRESMWKDQYHLLLDLQRSPCEPPSESEVSARPVDDRLRGPVPSERSVRRRCFAPVSRQHGQAVGPREGRQHRPLNRPATARLSWSVPTISSTTPPRPCCRGLPEQHRGRSHRS